MASYTEMILDVDKKVEELAKRVSSLEEIILDLKNKLDSVLCDTEKGE